MSQLAETSGVKKRRRPGPNPVDVSLSDADCTPLNAIKAKKEDKGKSQLGETSGVEKSRRPGPNPVRRPGPNPVRRPGPNPMATSLSDADRTLLNAIKAEKDAGIRARDIKWVTKLAQPVVKKSIESLLSKKMIKEVANIQYKFNQKHYMAVEFEPSKAVGGGVWYTEGTIDKDLITVLKRILVSIIRLHKVATADVLCDLLNKSKVVNFVCSKEQAGEILNFMILDGEIMEVKSTGLREFQSIPVGEVCYRAVIGNAVGKEPKLGPMALIPCGACPMIAHCTMDGIISPATCVYYNTWSEALDF